MSFLVRSLHQSLPISFSLPRLSILGWTETQPPANSSGSVGSELTAIALEKMAEVKEKMPTPDALERLPTRVQRQLAEAQNARVPLFGESSARHLQPFVLDDGRVDWQAALLTSPQFRSALADLSEHRLAYAAVLAARLPESYWHKGSATYGLCELALVGVLDLVMKACSDSGAHGRSLLLPELFRLAAGVSQRHLTHEERIAGAGFRRADYAFLRRRLTAVEKELLACLNYTLQVDPVEIEEARVFLRQSTLRAESIAERLFCQRVFRELCGDVYAAKSPGMPTWSFVDEPAAVALGAVGRELLPLYWRQPCSLPRRVSSSFSSDLTEGLEFWSSSGSSSSDSDTVCSELMPTQSVCAAEFALSHIALPVTDNKTAQPQSRAQLTYALRNDVSCPQLPLRAPKAEMPPQAFSV